MRSWLRPTLLVLSPFVLFGGCALACPAVMPEPVTLTSISLRVRAQEGRMIDEANEIVADPDSQTSFEDLDRPIVARRDGAAVVGWRWVDGIPAKSYGPVYDPDGLIERYDDLVTGDLAFTGCAPLFGPWWYCRLY